MAYRFKLDEKIDKGFRRIAREQMALAVDELSVANIPAAAIHASRKAIKRLRALIRAASPALGAKDARRHDTALRDIARQLSHRRDTDVMEETIAKLEACYGSEAVGMLRPLRTAIEGSIATLPNTLEAGVLEAIRGALVDEGRRLAKARLKGHGLTQIIDGITKTYGDGRRALKRAYNSTSDENVHELRKTVQAHWRHMALLMRAWPEEFGIRIEAARELSQLLGDDHDLSLLKQAAQTLPEGDAKAIIVLCECRQAELRAAAHPRAERLYAEQPKDFARRLTVYWHTGRELKLSAKTSSSQPLAKVEAKPASADVPAGSPTVLAAKTPG